MQKKLSSYQRDEIENKDIRVNEQFHSNNRQGIDIESLASSVTHLGDSIKDGLAKLT